MVSRHPSRPRPAQVVDLTEHRLAADLAAPRPLSALSLPQIAVIAELWELADVEASVIEESHRGTRPAVVQLLLDIRRERLIGMPRDTTRPCPRCSWPQCPTPDEPGHTH